MSGPYRYCPQCATPLADAEISGKVRRVCPACGFVQFHDPKVAVCVFIEQVGRVLLVKRGVEPELGKWALPAGYVDYGEEPQSAAIREAWEETGLQIEISALWDVMFYQGAKAVITIIYAGTVRGGILQAGDDAQEAAWFPPDALPEIGFESTRRALARWLTSDAAQSQSD